MHIRIKPLLITTNFHPNERGGPELIGPMRPQGKQLYGDKHPVRTPGHVPELRDRKFVDVHPLAGLTKQRFLGNSEIGQHFGRQPVNPDDPEDSAAEAFEATVEELQPWGILDWHTSSAEIPLPEGQSLYFVVGDMASPVALGMMGILAYRNRMKAVNTVALPNYPFFRALPGGAASRNDWPAQQVS